MNVIEINQKLLNIFKDILNYPHDALGDHMTPEHIAEWDSINHITLIMEIQSEFGIVFTTLEIKAIKSVGDLQDVILKHLSIHK